MGGHRGVTEGGLHYVDGGAALEGVSGVDVAKPVRRRALIKGCVRGGGVDQATYLRGGEEATPSTRIKDRHVRRYAVADRQQLAPDGSRQEDDTRLAAFAVGGDLAGVAALAQVAPGHSAALIVSADCSKAGPDCVGILSGLHVDNAQTLPYFGRRP